MVDYPTGIDNVVIGAMAGAIFFPVIGACTNALIPIAMSSFGAVDGVVLPMAAGGSGEAANGENESLVPVLINIVKRFGRRTRSKKRLL